MKRKAFLSLLLVFFAGCAPYAIVGGQHAATAENFVVELPSGWRRHSALGDDDRMSRAVIGTLQKRRNLDWDVVRITRDGLLLQQIAVGRIPLDAELPHTKLKLTQGMLPSEAAELISDNFRSNSKLTRQEILENVPSVVGGFPGFKLRYTYRADQELKIEGVFYGSIVDRWLYYVLYEAPAQHYFGKDLGVFEKTRASFQITKHSP